MYSLLKRVRITPKIINYDIMQLLEFTSTIYVL
uniref:Uncharacterized protein n=1 Tax=Arundo donax TaxID=35708 RepID=A0A0A8XTC2_ARUDO